MSLNLTAVFITIAICITVMALSDMLQRVSAEHPKRTRFIYGTDGKIKEVVKEYE